MIPCSLHLNSDKGLIQGKKKHININKFAGLSRDWVGAKNLFFVFFLRVIPYGGEKHINKIPPKILGQSRDNFVYVFILYVFFCSLMIYSKFGGRVMRTSMSVRPKRSDTRLIGVSL